MVPTPRRLPSRRWVFPESRASEAAELARQVQVPRTVSDLLLARGVETAEDADRFLNPKIEHLLDPYSMLGMTAAVARIQAAVRDRECILIYGDYDVDGTTAIVLLKTAIEMLGGQVRFHVPHRLREGYGMQGGILTEAAASGVRLVISVDTGIRAFAEAEVANQLGLDLIVTDHHLPEVGADLPRALAVLNPNQPGCTYACKHLCGAGVAFKLAQALLEAQDLERARVKILPSFLKMVAIATIADAVPLLGENRVFAAIGMEQLRRPVQPGLRALFQVAKLDPAARRLTSTDIAFRIAPRINAAGRMDVASEVVELFTTREASRAQELAAKLDRLNTDRRDEEAATLKEIEKQVEIQIASRLEDSGDSPLRCLVVDGNGWHRGVIGILASRVVDQTGLPALVVANDVGNGESHGSGRSVPGFHLLDAIESCRALFTRYGGHAHAVGFSLPTSRVPELRERMTAYAALHLADECLEGTLPCHAELPLDAVTPELYAWLRRMDPVGMGNEEPIFVARNVRLTAPPRTIKERHIKLQLSAAAPNGARNFAALGWHWAERVAALNLAEGSTIDLAYRLRENEHPDFGGLELEIAGLIPATEPSPL